MPASPLTRWSLVVRLRSAEDHEAWTEFTAIYEPLILRLVSRYGLQECDARDICQQVFEAVAKDIDQWQPDNRDGSFRRWLFRIAKNRVLKFLAQQRKKPRATGGTTVLGVLHNQPERGPSVSDVFEREYRQQLMSWAAERIRAEFRPSTWEAFWQTCVLGRSIGEVAAELGMSAGNVYVCRSRIIARLKNKVGEVLDEDT
jgi:RNA polymerase sigma-70 factor (ECF subfamily)